MVCYVISLSRAERFPRPHPSEHHVGHGDAEVDVGVVRGEPLELPERSPRPPRIGRRAAGCCPAVMGRNRRRTSWTASRARVAGTRKSSACRKQTRARNGRSICESQTMRPATSAARSTECAPPRRPAPPGSRRVGRGRRPATARPRSPAAPTAASGNRDTACPRSPPRGAAASRSPRTPREGTVGRLRPRSGAR